MHQRPACAGYHLKLKSMTPWSVGPEPGRATATVAFHHSCGQLLQQRLGYNLNFNHVWPLLRQRSSCKHDPSTAPCWQHAGEDVSSNHLNCSYGGIDRYHRVSRDDVEFEEADFAFRFVSAADEYMLLDPLQCSSNADRIVRVWEPLVKQFQQAAGKGKGKHTSSKGKGNGGGPSRDAHAHGGKPGTKGGSTAAAVAGRGKGSQLQDGKKARKQGALARAQAAEKAATVLQLMLSHAGSPRNQLTLAAQLLPLSSTMPQLLAGRMQLVVAANTWPKVQQVATWLRRYGGLVTSVDLNAVVDCCGQDACRANKKLLNVMSSMTTKFKSLRLLSLSAHMPDSSKKAARKLLRSLPFSHLTSLHLTGSCKVGPRAAAALTAATALRDLTLPGAGLEKALAAHPGVLLAGLQRLHLSDAGTCSAAALGALSIQLSALTHLSLAYNPLPAGCRLLHGAAGDKAAGVVASVSYKLLRRNSMIVDDVQDCWAQLPALRSLQIGSRKVLQDYGWVDEYEELVDGDGESSDDFGHAEPPQGLFLEGNRRLLHSLVALTGLTSLTLGPSAWLQECPEGDGLKGLLPLLHQLTGLQQLVLTLQVRKKDWTDNASQKALMRAMAALPELQDLAISGAMCGRQIGRLRKAEQLTRLELVTADTFPHGAYAPVMQFDKEHPGLMVFTPCGRPDPLTRR